MRTKWIRFEGGPFDGLEVAFRGGPPVPTVMYLEPEMPRLESDTPGMFIAQDGDDRVVRYELGGVQDVTDDEPKWLYETPSVFSRWLAKVHGEQRPSRDVYFVHESPPRKE